MKFKQLSTFIAAALILAGLILFTSWKAGVNNFEEERTEIVMRKIGHEVLLLSGDSSSRVLPVKQLTSDEYQIRFETAFAFVPDSLLKTIKQVISTYKLPSDYIVNVIDCTTKEVIFGYAILTTEKNDIISCVGRNQPRGCYFINIKFKTNGLFGLQRNVWIYGGTLLATCLLFFGVRRFYKSKKISQPNDSIAMPVAEKGIRIGKYIFQADKQCLILNGESIELTLKETELLCIFANSPNEVIDRGRLQKEVWEDNGVIVGRSLDMFISKLRKKLEDDPAVKLVNIHGKGYKLEAG